MPLVIQLPVDADALRQRVRAMVESRAAAATPRARWRGVLGWKSGQAPDGIWLEPRYAGSRNPARFVGTIEASATGSRLVGRVTHTWFTCIVMSVLIAFTSLAALVALAQRHEPAFKVVGIATLMIGTCVLLVRYELRSTAALIEEGLTG